MIVKHVAARLPSLGVALLVLSAAVAYERAFGFRLGGAAGSRAELWAAVAIVIASLIVFAPFGRRRCLTAAGLSFLAAFALWAANTEFSTSLDVRYGGAYGYSGERVAMVTWLVGPVVAGIAAVCVFAAALLPVFNRRVA